MNILHVTDFHIAEKDAIGEHLREGHYQEYVKHLKERMEQAFPRTVDSIVATGDFVDRGAVSNFPHAKKVLLCLGQSFGVAPKNIVVCLGNHDRELKFDIGGDEKRARRGFRSFAKDFANADATFVAGNGRAQLIYVAESYWALVVDSTMHYAARDRPGELEHKEVDEIMSSLLLPRVRPSDVLVVVSHFPVVVDPSNPVPTEERNWRKRHVWEAGIPLYNRISEFRNGTKTLWLSGDIHINSFQPDKDWYFVTTGRFGVKIDKKRGATAARREARVISLDETGKVDLLRARYEPRGSSDTPHVGESHWEWSIEDVPSSSSGAQEHMDGVAVVTSPKLSQGRFTLSTELEEMIRQALSSEEIYRLVRVQIRPDKSALSWISINRLINYPTLMERFLDDARKWIKERILGSRAFTARDGLMVGLDAWGAAFAGTLSVETGIPCRCVGARSGGREYSIAEQISAELVSEVQGKRFCIIIVDVVSTAETVDDFYRSIEARLGPIVCKNTQFFLMSIISDRANPLRKEIRYIEEQVSACDEVPCLVVENCRLPDAAILPAVSRGE